MLRVVALGAFLIGSVLPVAAVDQTVEQAYLKALKDLAAFRVEQQNCVGDLTSTVRDATNMVLEWSEEHQIMPRSKALDLVNDQQIFQRNATGYRCYNRGSKQKAFFDSSYAYLEAHKRWALKQ